MFRRFLFLLALVTLVGLGTRAFAAQFADTVGTPYETAFDYLSRQNIVQGYGNGMGAPYNALNRAEALKVVMGMKSDVVQRVAQVQKNIPPIPLFLDIDQSAWYAPYVEVAYEKGIVTGYPDQTLRPAQLVRVEEAIAMLLRTYNIPTSGGSAQLSNYIQNAQGEWWTGYVNAAIEKNLIMHYGRLTPGTAITRGQFFDMAYRLHNISASNKSVFAGAEPQVGNNTYYANAQQNYGQTSGGSININAGQPAGTSSGPLPQYASEKYFSISMPALGINDLAINHPSDPFTKDGILAPLQNGVGHLFSYPGGGGKIMIYGHSSGYPWDVSDYTKIFRKVNQLNAGDKIFVTYDGTMYEYEVAFEQTVKASDTTPFNDNGAGEELILYTCWPPDSIQERYLVHAYPVRSVALR